MTPEERQGFFADETSIDIDDYIVETYWFETDADPRDAAASLCREQSTAQWARPGIDEDFRPLHAAKVIGLGVVEEARQPSFASPFARGDRFFRCVARIAHPHRNFGGKIPNLLTAAAGEGVFFCHHVNAVKLIDLGFPPSYMEGFEGPQFGTDGLRKLLGVSDRPLFFGVIKPNIGLDADSYAELAYQSWLGGLDVAKDDEILADSPSSPLKARAMCVGHARCEAEQKTGVPKVYLANITDEVDRLCELHDIAVAAGANAVLVNAAAVGLSAVRMLRRHTDVPLVAHFAMIAPFSRLPFFGISSTVFTKLQRMMGFDAIIMPGFGKRMMTTEEEVAANCSVCAKPMRHIRRSLPIPGGSDWAGTLATTVEKLGTIDFGIVPGRGVFGHPMGPKAGAKSLHQAWEAYLLKMPITTYAVDHPELKSAIETFDKPRSAEEGINHEASVDAGDRSDHVPYRE